MPAQSGDGNLVFRDAMPSRFLSLTTQRARPPSHWDIEIVPSVFCIDADGRVQSHFEGFVRDEWQALSTELSESLGLPAAQIDWDGLPAWRPGCGSKHLYPEIYDKLINTPDGGLFQARRIEIAHADDVIEFMFDQGFSDGLPLVPPTPERVLRMLARHAPRAAGRRRHRAAEHGRSDR